MISMISQFSKGLRIKELCDVRPYIMFLEGYISGLKSIFSIQIYGARRLLCSEVLLHPVKALLLP